MWLDLKEIKALYSKMGGTLFLECGTVNVNDSASDVGRCGSS